MRGSLSIMVLLASVLCGIPANAAPPPVHLMGVTTLFSMTEAGRGMVRELRVLPPERKRLRMKTIVIDPGHGGTNKGAIGVAKLREKRLTIELAWALRDAIEAAYPDVNVQLTRYWDREVGLDERIDWANSVHADLFISLHYNAATHDRAIGYETYFLADETIEATAEPGSRKGQEATPTEKRAFRVMDKARVRAHAKARQLLVPAHERSRALADITQLALAKNLTDSVNRGVKQANFAVLRGARMPAVVVESGFLTHPVEGQAVLGDAHRHAVVAALVDAIGAFDKTLPARPAVKATPVATQ